MAIAGADLLTAQGGDLDPSLFPDLSADQLSDLLDAYVADGTVRAAALASASEQDEAARQWAYARAYGYKLTLLANTPASEAVEGDGSRSISAAQLAVFQRLRDDALARYTALVPVTTGAETGVIPASRAVAVAPTW